MMENTAASNEKQRCCLILCFVSDFSVDLLSLQENLEQEPLFGILQITVQLPLDPRDAFDQRAAVQVQLCRGFRYAHVAVQKNAQRFHIADLRILIMAHEVLQPLCVIHFHWQIPNGID